VTEGLRGMHRQNVVHRDIKLENLLLSASGDSVKIADYGLARHSPPNEDRSTMCGSVRYISPEMARHMDSNGNCIGDLMYDGRAVDVWSTGVLLFTMLVSQPSVLHVLGEVCAHSRCVRCLW
jgi:serine/threonine protein kinase